MVDWLSLDVNLSARFDEARVVTTYLYMVLFVYIWRCYI